VGIPTAGQLRDESKVSALVVASEILKVSLSVYITCYRKLTTGVGGYQNKFHWAGRREGAGILSLPLGPMKL